MKVQDLKEKHRAKALDNILDDRGDAVTIRRALEMELDAAFVWSDSREGEEYWIKIFNKYNK
jgi:predicted DNA-binding protein (UPF0278 family)